MSLKHRIYDRGLPAYEIPAPGAGVLMILAFGRNAPLPVVQGANRNHLARRGGPLVPVPQKFKHVSGGGLAVLELEEEVHMVVTRRYPERRCLGYGP